MIAAEDLAPALRRGFDRAARRRWWIGVAMWLALAPLGGLAAQILPDTLTHGYDASDIEALRPIVHDALREDQPGMVRPWQSPSGRHGLVHLVSGGAVAGSDHAKLRITTFKGDEERLFITFRYCLDAGREWRLCG